MALSSSCDDGDGDSGCFRGQKGPGLWKVLAAGPTLPPLLRSRCVGWSRTNWMLSAGAWWRGDWKHGAGKKKEFEKSCCKRQNINVKMSPPGPISSTANASGQVVITVVPPRVVEEICSGAETVAVYHSSWSLKTHRC